MLNRKAQSTMEFSAVVIVVIGALLVISTYVKRGIQGRWKAAVDDIGEQYDPAYMNTRVTHVITGTTTTTITTREADAGRIWTEREDVTDGSESRFGYTRVGSRALSQSSCGSQDDATDEDDDDNDGDGGDDDGNGDDSGG